MTSVGELVLGRCGYSKIQSDGYLDHYRYPGIQIHTGTQGAQGFKSVRAAWQSSGVSVVGSCSAVA